jgi:hypothetical protein
MGITRRFSINPWREGKENVELRQAFEDKFGEAIK